MKKGLWLFFLALVIRFAVAAYWRFDGLYGQDAFAYFRQAAALAERLPRSQLPPLDFIWPNGYPLLAAAFMSVLGPTALAAQLPALLAGAALAPLVYALAKALFPADGEPAGIVAGLIVAVAGQPILSSVSAMSDMPALFWAMLAALLAVKATGPDGRPVQFLAAGLALGLAVVTRWLMLLLAPALVVYVLCGLRQQRARWRQPALAAAGGLLILLPQLWLTANRPDGLFHQFLLGWEPANALRRAFVNPDGIYQYELPPALFYAQPASHPAYIFPLLGLAALWGLWLLGRRRAWGPLILLAGWAGAAYLFLAGIPYENFRYGLTLYPPLVILTGLGTADLLGRRPGRRWGETAVVLSLLAMALWSIRMNGPFLRQVQTSKAIARAVDQALPPEATLVTFGLTLTIEHYTDRQPIELFLLREAERKALVMAGIPFYLLVDPNNLAAQWSGFPPAEHFDWLGKHTQLRELARYGPYVLYQVSPALVGLFAGP